MRFTIAKPADYMRFGDLFYSKPRTKADREQFEQLAEICRKRAEEEFPCSKDGPENDAILNQMEEELHIIDKTDIFSIPLSSISSRILRMYLLLKLLFSEAETSILKIMIIFRSKREYQQQAPWVY